MAQFDVYRNAGPLAALYPLQVDVQTDLLAGLESRMVIPLARSQLQAHRTMRYLQPEVVIAAETYVLMTPELAARDRRDLTDRVGSIAHCRSDIITALDMLFTGA